ncbi:MAG TPA: LacI family DNA-binding transcriptional regulator, partial [Humibacter sp.]|nr:LacI family DNA-binding transcriptional regulator [Humibacter sp.]
KVRSSAPLHKPPTIYDVARAAGVSHQTVSRLLKGDQGIKPANRERVLRALDELRYRPNMAARSLATSRSHRVAALTQEIGLVGPGQIAQAAAIEARQRGYVLDMITLDIEDGANVEEAIRLANQQDVAGILALASTDELAAAFRNTEFHVPFFIASDEDQLDDGDDPEGVSQALDQLAAHLKAFGHVDILHVAGPLTRAAGRNRERFVRKALADNGLALTDIIDGDWSARSGYQAVRSALQSFSFTAVIAANDQMAIGAIRALHEAGFDVPGDVSVTGVDDIPESAFVTPQLTTIHLNFETLGRNAFCGLLAEITGNPIEPLYQPAELVIRESTGPAGRGPVGARRR